MTTRRPRRFALALLTLLPALLAAPRPASAVTVSGCLAGKLGDVGGAVVGQVACHAKQAARSDAARLAACLEKAEARFDGGGDPMLGRFAKRERRPGCVTTGDQVALAARVATYVNGLEAAVGNAGTANACDAAKLRCVGAYAGGVLACLARAAKSGGVVDVRCLVKQEERLGDSARGCLRKAAARGVCSAADGGALADGADAFAAATLCALDPPGAGGCPGLPTPVPTPTRTATPVPSRTPTPLATSGAAGAAQDCVDMINAYRASIGRPPYARWTAAEGCADDQAHDDSQSHVPHGAFGQCGEWAQNECPGWPGPPAQMIGSCLQAMWNEGPGDDFATHGHYINMSSTSYTKVACGFHVTANGSVWAVQDFQ